jgi:hypothetical protein
MLLLLLLILIVLCAFMPNVMVFFLSPLGLILICLVLGPALLGIIFFVIPGFLSHWLDRVGFDRLSNRAIILASLTGPFWVFGFLYLLARN